MNGEPYAEAFLHGAAWDLSSVLRQNKPHYYAEFGKEIDTC